MLGDYQQIRLSEYARIYDILIPSGHIFRRMNEEIDFSFVRKELQDKYSAGMGRSAEDPVRMFKYLMLKAMHPASDEDLVKRAYTDMLEVLESYLPKQLSQEEIEAEVRIIITEVGATSMKEMGKVMGTASKQLAGKADGRVISEIVKKLLA